MHGKRYFSLVDIERYAWATKELVQSAEESVNELEGEFTWNPELILLFIPLADFEPSGAYSLAPERAVLIAHADGSIKWSDPSVKETAFADFERESLNASATFHDYLVRLLTYALAHGMDVAKLNREGSGRSILHSLPHSALHTDVGEYES